MSSGNGSPAPARSRDEVSTWALNELRENWVSLPDKPDETPESTAEALVSFALSSGASNLEERVRDLVSRRKSGVPLAYIVGRQKFFGIEFLAGPEALIPRKETEILVGGALTAVRAIASERGHARVIDLCCGAGTVALSIAASEPNCTVFGGDISADCITLANRNAAHLHLQERATFRESDVFAGFESPEFLGRIDVVTCNPPYISSAKVEKMAPEIANFEPRLAFDGGPFGVKILTRLIREAPRYLRPGGVLAFEVGLGQANAMSKMLHNAGGYEAIDLLPDAHGEPRALVAKFVGAK